MNSVGCANSFIVCAPFVDINGGQKNVAQPTYNVGWDVATAESQQSEHGDDNYALGGCPRIENLLRKIHFGQLSRSFSLNRTTIRLK